MENQAHDGRCGAKTRKGTPCLQKAGWGTNHVGSGRCKLHGGKSTGPKNQQNNKNALSTGEHESIWMDALEEDEQEIINKINLDKLSQTNEEIKLTDIRIRRMLMRIKKLNKEEYIRVGGKEGFERGGETKIVEMEHSLTQIQNIEEALTRVQNHKSKLIDLKHKLELDLGIDNDIKLARLDNIKANTEKLESENTKQAPPVINIIDTWTDEDD